MALQDDFNPHANSALPAPPAANDNGGADTGAENNIWFGLQAQDYPALGLPDDDTVHVVRNMVPLPVADTPELKGHEAEIEAALIILSQSPTGRALLQTALDAGYHIHINPTVVGGADAADDVDTQGNADPENKRINLRAAGDVYALAANLGHELRHVTQFVKGGLDIHIRREHPVSALRQLLAMEADARAHEILIAKELAFGEKDAPEGRLVFPRMIEKTVDVMGISMVEILMEKVTPRLPDDVAMDKVMAGVFKAFYSAPGMRRHYEGTILNMLERQSPAELRTPENFQGITTAAELLEKIDAAAGPAAYLQKNAAGFIDLDAPSLLSVSQKTQERLDKLVAVRHENPHTRNDAPWQAAVYDIVIPKPPAPPAQKNAGPSPR